MTSSSLSLSVSPSISISIYLHLVFHLTDICPGLRYLFLSRLCATLFGEGCQFVRAAIDYLFYIDNDNNRFDFMALNSLLSLQY